MDVKHCKRCDQLRPVSCFSKNKAKKDGLQVYCRGCQTPLQQRWYGRHTERQLASNTAWIERHRERVADRERHRRMIISKPPAWCDVEAIEAIYREAAGIRASGTWCEVDHIVPIESPIVCGLHVAWNLRIVTRSVNSTKGNRVWPDMP